MTNISDNTTMEQLAMLSAPEYDRVRQKKADALNIRVTTLDKEIEKLRQTNTHTEPKKPPFRQTTPYPSPVKAELLFDEIVTTIDRFIACDKATKIATALWCGFTWLIDHVQVAPIALITAPEMRCGKSQLLQVIHQLSYNPIIASNISSAAVFRVIEAYRPTLLIDEADTFLKQNEELRGIINSGHTRQSAYVIRVEGDNHEPKQFCTWSAKAICGIGTMASTIQDRAIILEMRRKLPNESVERMRHAEPFLFKHLSSKLARFALDSCNIIKNAKPTLPNSLNDRAQDNWEPLLAIADCIGGKWPKLARDTAISIACKSDATNSSSNDLLFDIRDIFISESCNRISTQDLIQHLAGSELRPWSTYRNGKVITPHQLAKLLRAYNIKSKDIRFGYGQVLKGYEIIDFEDAFTRYLIPVLSPSEMNATMQQALQNISNISSLDVAPSPSCSATNYNTATLNSGTDTACSDVASTDENDKIIEVVL